MTKNLIYLLVFTFIITFVSCDKDNGNKDNGDGNSDVSINTISAKWEISDNNSPYISFEFTKDGNYIVVENVETNLRSLNTSLENSLFKNNNLEAVSTRSSESESFQSPIYFGTYRIEGNKIVLTGFGLIEVVSITADEFTFSLTPEATGQKNRIVAGKSNEPISSSSKSDMLCRTWIIEKYTDENNNDIPDEDDFMGSIVLFSRAGTYLVLKEEGWAGLAEWKWANSQETELYCSWENWTDDWRENIVKITVTSTSLIVRDVDNVITHLRLK